LERENLILKEPDLLSIQINSFNTFIQEGAAEKENIGLHSVFQSVFPITALNGYAEIEYLDYELQEPKYNVKECKLEVLLMLQHCKLNSI